jgi:UDP-N-acetylglucosamine 1-carboxyvinyltransferase
METFVVTGGKPLHGTVTLGGAKNVALKVLIASLLTDERLIIHNVPILRDVLSLLDVLKSLGVVHTWEGHTLIIQNKNAGDHVVPLEMGARLRASSMVLGPLLARYHEAKIPNPGGCRLGARPIDRHIDALRLMGATIDYSSDDGYFYAKAKALHGAVIEFPKNTHTGTETLLLAAVLAQGTTVLKNAAEEVEVNELITLLNSMGAHINRSNPREITIEGVKRLHSATYTIQPDRNEEVTFAIAAAITGGRIVVEGSNRDALTAFLTPFTNAGGKFEAVGPTKTAYWVEGPIKPTDIVTLQHPGFMTDWQAPWAVFMTQATGVSSIHETVFESRFSYVSELKKMGASIEFYDPEVTNPDEFYNFNWADRVEGYHQGVRIIGPTVLHNGVVDIDDLRAGATLILAALAAHGESYIHGAEQVDRGYENIEQRLTQLGATITRVKEESV